MALTDLVAGKSYLVLGLGVTGIATANALHKAGAKVFAWDDRPQADEFLFELVNPLTAISNLDVDALVMSPGIPHTHPEPHPIATWAKERNLPIIGDIELLILSQPDRNFIGITGTNGKSTTTALVAHILEETGTKYSVGGNLGPAALGLNDPGVGGWYVLEMSSYQLELMDQARFDVSAFLNLTPDHLERHGGLKGYTEAKYRILSQLRNGGQAVISIDQNVGQEFARRTSKTEAIKVVRVSTEDAFGGVSNISTKDGCLYLDDKENFDLTALTRFPGKHNWQNFGIAYGICSAAGLSDPEICQAMKTFGGLEHRQEFVGKIGNVEFVNDSKGTNPEATEVALSAYKSVYWVVGGQAKAEGVKPLLHLSDRIKCAYLIGESSDRFAEELSGHIPYVKCGTLEVAVEKAFNDANQANIINVDVANLASLHNPVILLSPACASWDQFKSFEARGDAFKSYFQRLKTEQ